MVNIKPHLPIEALGSETGGGILKGSHMYESQLEQEFFKYLLKLGFPRTSIIHQPSFGIHGKIIRPDFALLASTSKNIIAIFEVKSGSPKLSPLFEQTRNYLSTFKVFGVKAFYAVPGVIPGEFDFYLVNDKDLFEKIDKSFINYESLETAAVVGKAEAVSQEKRTEVDSFHRLCVVLACIIGLVVIADVFVVQRYGFSLLTSQRLYLLLALVVLLVIPFFQKFKIFGWEAERYEQDLKRAMKNENEKK